MLQSAGLIELEDGGTIFSDRRRHRLVDVEGEGRRRSTPSLTATSLPDVAAAIINNDFVEDAGLTFEDAIAQDDPTDPNALPYVNIFAARAEDADNATYLKLVEIYQNDPGGAGRRRSRPRAAPPCSCTTPVADLEASLADVEDDIRAKLDARYDRGTRRVRAVGASRARRRARAFRRRSTHDRSSA